MLTMFTYRLNWHKLTMKLYVDCERQTADLTITYNRRVVHIGRVAYLEVNTPDLAGAWLSRAIKTPDGEVELLQWWHDYAKREAEALAA